MIYVVELPKYSALFPGIAKFLDRLLDALHGSGKAAAALFDDAAFVRANSTGTVRGSPPCDKFFERGQDRLLLVVLREIEPNASINKNFEHGIPSLRRRHHLDLLRPLISVSVKNEITERHGRVHNQNGMMGRELVFPNLGLTSRSLARAEVPPAHREGWRSSVAPRIPTLGAGGR
jgi:hypothetical protein